jgi:hypothetical protein
MSCSKPTGDCAAVPLDLPVPQAKILRGTFASCLEGATDDLRVPDQLPDPDRVQREADAYRRLLAALDIGAISVPDEEARTVVEAMVLSIEQDPDYSRVIAEHDALFDLLSLLGGTEVRAG